MSAALVSANSMTFGTSGVITWGATPTAGNLGVLVATVVDANGTLQCNTSGWVAVAVITNPALTTMQVGMWYKPNLSGGDVSPTVLAPIGGQGGTASIFEISGCVTTSPLEGSQTATGSGSPLSIALASADANAGNAMVGVDYWHATKSGTITSGASYNNATAVIQHQDDASSTVIHHCHHYGMPTTSNSAADSNSATSTSMATDGVASILASFKVSVTATPSLAPPIRSDLSLSEILIVNQGIGRSGY